MKSKLINFIFYVLTFLQVMLIRFSTHHIETLDWDINAFLVTSLEFGRGNLPYEFQYENKPPLLFLIYYFYSVITKNNVFYIKIINDILLFLILIIMSNLYKDKNSNWFTKFIPPFIFILLISNVWFHPGYSEYLVIFFLAIAQLLIVKNLKYKYILIGLMLGFASLVNLGSAIFLFSFLLITNLNNGVNLKRNAKLCIGFFIPHFVTIYIYSLNNLLFEYYMANIEIPLSYISSNFSFTKALTIFLIALESYNIFIYLLLLICITLLIYKIFKNTLFQIKDSQVIELAVLNFSSLLFFYLAGKGYYHHILLFLYFVSFSTKWILKKIDRRILITIIFISLILVNQRSYDMTSINLKNFKNIQSNYPIYQITNEIKNEISENDIIFSTDNILLLYYLNKQNSSYIVHPALYDYVEITNVLENYSKISSNEIFQNIAKQPKILELNSNDKSFNDYQYLKTDYINLNLLNYWSKNPSVNIYIKSN